MARIIGDDRDNTLVGTDGLGSLTKKPQAPREQIAISIARRGAGLPLYHLVLLAVAYYGVVAAFALGKPLGLDETWAAGNAGAIARSGFAALGDAATGRGQIGHTLLHQHLLATFFATFGETTLVARLLGAACFVASILLIWRLAAAVYPGRKGEVAGAVAALLYAANPFVIQYSLLVDQETTVLPLGLLLFFHAAYRRRLEFTPRTIAVLSLLFAVAVWCKEFTPYFILPALGLFLWLRDGFLRAVAVTAQIGVYGTVVFVATWTLYCTATGVPPLSFWEFSVVNKALAASFHEERTLRGAFDQWVDHTARWLTPALLALTLAAAAARGLALWRGERRLQPADFLWFYVAVFWAITNLHMYFAPRYQVPLYSVVVVLVAGFLYDVLKDTDARRIASAVAAGAVVAVGMALALEDPLLLPSRGQYLALYLAMPLAVCAVLLAGLGARPWTGPGGVLLLVALLTASSLSLSVKQSRGYATAVSWRGQYGERGFNETLAFLRAHVGDTVPVVRKDLAYYLVLDRPERRRAWIYNRIFRDLGQPSGGQKLAQALAREDVRYLIVERFSHFSDPTLAPAALAECCQRVVTFGDFQIFRKIGK